jgi:hypothetical protein
MAKVVVSRSPSWGRGSNGLGAALASAIRGRRSSRVRVKARCSEVLVRVGVRFHDWIGRNAPELTPPGAEFRGGSGDRDAQ